MGDTKKQITVLYVDDEINNLTAFKATFRRLFRIFTAPSAKEAKRVLEQNTVHVLISDQRMPAMTGIEFFEAIIHRHPEPIRILLTGYADINAVIDAINKGHVYKYISKPWDEEEMKKHIEKAYHIYTLRKERKELTDKLLDVNQKLEFLVRQRLLS